MKKQDKTHHPSRTIRAARKRLLAASQSVIRGFVETYELGVWYDTDTRLKYTYCWLGTDMYYAVENVYLN